MKSAELFTEALKRGLTPKEAVSSLATYELEYCARLPINIHRASQELGLQFFPIPRFDRFVGASLFRHRATNDLQQLNLWARRRPNWALATGTASGVFTLLVNGQEGQESLLSHCGDDWSWLDTLRISAGQKRFILFRWPSGWRQREGSLCIGKGLCVLGEGAWHPMPPSRHNCVEHVYLHPQMLLLPPAAWLLNLVFDYDDDESALQSPVANSFCRGIASHSAQV